MSWVSGWFTTTQVTKFAPESSHASTTFSDVQKYAEEESKSHQILQTRQNTINMEEEEEIRRPYWQVCRDTLLRETQRENSG